MRLDKDIIVDFLYPRQRVAYYFQIVAFLGILTWLSLGSAHRKQARRVLVPSKSTSTISLFERLHPLSDSTDSSETNTPSSLSERDGNDPSYNEEKVSSEIPFIKVDLSQERFIKTWFGKLNPSVLIQSDFIYILLHQYIYDNHETLEYYQQPYTSELTILKYDYTWQYISEANIHFKEGEIPSDEVCIQNWHSGIGDAKLVQMDSNLYLLGNICRDIGDWVGQVDQYLISFPPNLEYANYQKNISLIHPERTSTIDEKSIYSKEWLIENNWIPFQWQGKTYVVHSITPSFCVNELDFTTKNLLKGRCTRLQTDDQNPLLGSAGVVKLRWGPTEYFALVAQTQQDRMYVQRVVLFEMSNEFKPVQVSKGFSFDCMKNWKLTTQPAKECGRISLTSLVGYKSDYLMGFSWQDRVAIVKFLSRKQLLSILPKYQRGLKIKA